MKLTAAVYRTDRTVLFVEAHSLVAGDLLEPFVLDFSRCGGALPDTETLTLVLKRSRTGETVLSVPSFSEVPNHRCLRSATLDLSVQAMVDWYADESSGGSPARRSVEGWLEISDRDGAWASCPVPVVLRDVTPRGDATGYYTAAQVDAFLARKQDTLSFDPSPVQGSANPVTSDGVFSALEAKADASDLASLAAGVSSLPSKTYVDARLTLKADLSALDGLVSSGDLASALAAKADAAALSSYVAKSDMPSYLGPYATTEAVASAVAEATSGFVSKSYVTSAVSGLATAKQLEDGLAAKADASDVEKALAEKADASALEALASKAVTETDLETKLSGYADKSYVSTEISSAVSSFATSDDLAELERAVAGKADASALESKADASKLEALEATVAGKVSKEYVDTTVDGLATSKSVADLDAKTAKALESKANAHDVSVALSEKADKATTYTMKQVDELIAQGGGGGGGTGQPGVTFLERENPVVLASGGDVLARLVLVERDGGAVSRVVVEGAAERYTGTHVLDEAGSWTSVSVSGGTVAFLPSSSLFRFSYDGTSVDVPCTVPQSLGTPMSRLADVRPVEGHSDRAVSSGGVHDHVEERVATRVTNELHLADLLETRLVTAQNATSCASAVRATTEFTSALLGLEQTLAKKTETEAALALKAPAFSVKSPLVLSGGMLSVDETVLMGLARIRPFNFVDPYDQSTWTLVLGAVNVVELSTVPEGGTTEVDLVVPTAESGVSRWFALSVRNASGNARSLSLSVRDAETGADAAATMRPDWAPSTLSRVLGELNISGEISSSRSAQVYECVPGVFTITENI